MSVSDRSSGLFARTLTNGDDVRVTFSGEIDIEVVETFTAPIDAAIAGGARSVVADLGDVWFMDSSGISALLRCAREAEAQRVSFRVERPQSHVLRVIQVTGVDGLLGLPPSSN